MSFPCEQQIEETCHATQKEKTLKHPVLLEGAGLFNGEKVSLRLCPAKAGFGIVFRRTDLEGSPLLPARLEFVQGTPRCTILGNNHVQIQTVEHLLAAVRAYGIDNLLIEISGSEVPIFDGSSKSFIEAFEAVGLEEQESIKKVYTLSKPLYWSQGDTHLVALPSDEYRISYTLHYPHSDLLRSQFYSVLVNKETFKNEIASCRTFSLYEEIAPWIEKGLIKGGNLENAILIKNDTVVNPEGLRFPEEMARHKILDMIGDFSLIARPFLAHIISIRSGHTSNTLFARELLKEITGENS